MITARKEGTMQMPVRRSMIDRMKGAAMLDVQTYEDVEADATATGQAAGVVLLVAAAQAIGASGYGGRGLIGGAVAAIVGWLLWSGITYLIGDKLLGGTATWGELLRTIGFAQTPGLLAVLGFLPVLGGLVVLVAVIWVLVAGIIAIRQALDLGTGKAILAAVLGWLAIAIPRAVLMWLGVGGGG
jgi:hypothetical protein